MSTLAQLLGGVLAGLVGADARVLLLVLAAAGIAVVVRVAREVLRGARSSLVTAPPPRAAARPVRSAPRTADPDAAGHVRARAPGRAA